ncbi:hypothetical protein ACFQMF_05435 [Halorubrum rutilum]|uniref:Type IV pilin n=1 Tax=Halorubrum rutilum TaxID=1364933 RepID=A0ABD6AII0_9EURY|nr:hypothetical protein [Halorubrum rutilum]
MSDRRSRTVAVDLDASRRAFGGDDRGVSDVVGYILVFSLITITIGTVFAVGITGVEDRREAERVANVERAFDVFDDNLRDVQRYGDPSRATEIRLAGGTLATSGETRFVLNRTTGGGDNVTLAEWQAGSLTYRDGDTVIAYDAGALVRSDGDGSVMLSDPRFVAAYDRTTIPIVDLVPEEADASVTGEGTVQITTVDQLDTGSETSRFDAAGETLHLRVESAHAGAWRRYFQRTDGFEEVTPAGADGVAVARIVNDDQVYVQHLTRIVSLRR